MRLRAWQSQAVRQYWEHPGETFMVCATPGAGKTAYACTVAAQALAERRVDQVIVVAPTDHLRRQWADAAAGFDLRLDPTLSNAVGPVPAGFHGYVTTYAQVASKAILHRHRTTRRKTLVILDEIHHAGDGLSWGEAVWEAFEPARRRLAMTGTPFRTGSEQIPFVSYADTGAGKESLADVVYSYTDALRDGVCRPVVFAAYTGVARWRNSAGDALGDVDEYAHELGSVAARSVEDRAWRVALDPAGDWIRHVIAAADSRLRDLRAHGTPDAAGLLLASDQDTARAYADVVVQVTGAEPVVVVSDDPDSSAKIEAFRSGTQPWIIAVRQVSEGTDIPRLAVLVYATSYRTPLFWQQAVGRVVRARNRRETATVFIPAVRPLLALAADLERQRNHVIAPPQDDALDLPERAPVEPGFGAGVEFVGADAQFAHVLASGRAYVPDEELPEEAEDFLGLPGLLTPEQTAVLLARRDAELKRQVGADAPAPPPAPPQAATWRDTQSLRKDISRLVGQLAARTSRSHAEIHLLLRRQVPGPPTPAADVDTLAERRDWLLAELN